MCRFVLLQSFLAAGIAALMIVPVSRVMADDAATQPATQPTTEAAASQPATSQPAVSVDQLTPRGTLKMMEVASIDGDSVTLKTLFATHSDLEKQVVSAWADNAAARTALGVAQLKKFAPTLDIAARRATLLDRALTAVDGLVETINGNNADVGLAGKPAVAKLELVDGKWEVPFSAAFGQNTADMNLRLQEFNIETDILKELTDDVSAGAFKSADEVQAAFQQRMTAAAKNLSATQPTTKATTQP
jgi:hypothetical protein